MLVLQRNLFLEVPCEPQEVISALEEVFQLLGLELDSLEGVEELAGKHNLHSFLALVVILYRAK